MDRRSDYMNFLTAPDDLLLDILPPNALAPAAG
jgi:hypothetical protein